MKPAKILIAFIFNLSIILSSWINAQIPELAPRWESKYFQFSAPPPAHWTLLPTLDSREKLLYSLIDLSDGKSYTVKFTPDVSQKKLSDEDYFSATREQMLSANAKNKLIEEQDIDFHGKIFHRQTFLMYTDKWGLMKMDATARRTGKYFVVVQMAYPADEKDPENTSTPLEIIELDKKIKIEEE